MTLHGIRMAVKPGETTLYGINSPTYFRVLAQSASWEWEFANEIKWTRLFTIFDNGGLMETSVNKIGKRRRESGLCGNTSDT